MALVIDFIVAMTGILFRILMTKVGTSELPFVWREETFDCIKLLTSSRGRMAPGCGSKKQIKWFWTSIPLILEASRNAVIPKLVNSNVWEKISFYFICWSHFSPRFGKSLFFETKITLGLIIHTPWDISLDKFLNWFFGNLQYCK